MSILIISSVHLQYRTVRFDTERIEEENYQGNAVVNYTQRDVPYTRDDRAQAFCTGRGAQKSEGLHDHFQRIFGRVGAGIRAILPG